jgi:prepilin-type N-terminal cleavage/methylation domain-containing protein
MNKRGFTLVEIMIVVAIIGLLAAIAIPGFVNARNESRASACVNNLRQIDQAKEEAAMANNWADARALSAGDITAVNGYLQGGSTPTCRAAGTYSYNNVGTRPTCSIAGAHVLPAS